MRLSTEIRAVLPPAPGVAPHLDGLPPCLHKYEPLFRRDDAPAQREPA